MRSLFGIVVLLGIAGLVGCGGGGGGGGATNPIVSSAAVINSSSSLPSQTSSSHVSSSQSPLVLQPITRANAAYFSVSVFDAFDVASTMPSIVKEMMAQANLLRDGQYSSPCDSGGTYSLVISNNRRLITETYTNCNSDGDVRTGRIYFDVLAAGMETSRVLLRYDNLKVASATDTSVYTIIYGDIEYEGEVEGGFDSDRLYDVKLNITEQNSIEGEHSLQNARFRLKYFTSDSFFPDKFAPEQSYSGAIAVSGKGAVNFEYVASEKKIDITGSTEAIARVTYDNELFIYWDAQNDGVPEAQLFIANTSGILDAITSPNGKIVPSGIDGLILENNSMYMSRGQTSEIDIRKTVTHSGISLLDYSLIVDGDLTANSDWSQIEPGKFVLNFSSNTEDKTYSLVFRVRDTDGKDVYDIPVSFFVGSDYDGDLVPDAFDDDDDNDGIRDEFDAYPLNEYESADTDGDGIPDNRDADADGDGVPNFADREPLDPSNCIVLGQRDSSGCYLEERSIKKPWMMDKHGVIHFEPYNARFGVRDATNYVYRLDVELAQFIDPIRRVGERPTYVAATNKIIYQLGLALYLVDLETFTTSLLIQLEQPLSLAYAEANHVVINRIRDRSTDSTYAESYDYTGQLISATPVYLDGRSKPIIALSRLDPNCPLAITSDDNGLLHHLSLRDDAPRCTPLPQFSSRLSPDGSRLYRPIASSDSGGIFSMIAPAPGILYTTFNDQPLITIPTVSRFEWVGENYVLQQQNSLTLFNATGVEVASTTFNDEEIHELFANAERIAVVTRPSDSAKTIIRVFDTQLTLLNSYEY